MAGNLNLEDYLVRYIVDYNPALGIRFANARERTFELGLGIKRALQNISFYITRTPNLFIDVKIKNTYKQSVFNKLAKELDNLSLLFLNQGEGEAKLTTRVREAMSNIETNVVNRFSEAPLDIITGQLINAINSQSPVVIQIKTGIRAGYMNKKLLNEDTQPYDSKTLSPRKQASKRYRYTTSDGGVVDATGYWAFHEFGTKSLKKRSFILNAVRALHGVDEKEIKNVEKWLEDEVNKFKEKAEKITSSS